MRVGCEQAGAESDFSCFVVAWDLWGGRGFG